MRRSISFSVLTGNPILSMIRKNFHKKGEDLAPFFTIGQISPLGFFLFFDITPDHSYLFPTLH